jgi:hypothetical protein
MIYCSVHGYIYGNPSNILRSVASNQVVCGQGDTLDYPYLYFFNPFASSNNRYCLKSCPYFDSNSNLVVPQCYPGHGSTPSCSSFTTTIDQSGSFTTAPSTFTNAYIGYQSRAVLGRVCLPNSSVLNNALSSKASSLTNSLQQLSFLNFGMDTINVHLYDIVELDMGAGCSMLCFFDSYGCISYDEMFCRVCCLGNDDWGCFGICWFWDCFLKVERNQSKYLNLKSV